MIWCARADTQTSVSDHSVRPNLHPPFRLVIAGTVVLMLLQACGTAPTRPGPAAARGPATESGAKEAEQAGEYVLAAREYSDLARAAEPPQRQHFQLKSAESLIKAGQIPRARERLEEIEVSGLHRSFRARKRILLALVASFEGSYEKAIRLLNRAAATPTLDPSLYSEIFRVRAAAELALGNPIGAVKDLVRREKYIVDVEEIDQNQLKIWETLNGMTLADLRQAYNLTRDPVLSGWLSLATAYAENPAAFAKAARNWRKKNPNHPATKSFLATIVSPRSRIIGRIDRIALLVPLTSDYALAAQAVRDGFLSLDAANTQPGKPSVRVYDTGSDPATVTEVYKQAVQDGAQFIVGPLGREAANRLVADDQLEVPTLLLSHVDSDTGDALVPVFQFGLPPEQEARQAAERAYLDGHRQAAVLYPNTSLGERMQRAFTEHWQRLGGIVLTAQNYEIDKNDYSEPIKALLNITQSEQRKRALEQFLKIRVRLEPRRRRDIDCIFLAADPKHGRLLKPQLNYHRASRLPVYSTSHIFSGRRDHIHDADLDGIVFGDMPWMLVEGGSVYTLRQTQGNWPYAYTQLDRLYALGLDSYAIIPYLNRISADSAIRFSGVTSSLSIDNAGRLHRQLLWAKFRRGLPRLLDTFYKYTGQLILQDGAATSGTPAARP